MKAFDVRAVETWLQELADIAACRAVVSEKGDLEELHVLAKTGRSPKQIVRDIETLLAIKTGEHVDHKKISVVQLDSVATQVALRRPKMGAVQFTVDGMLCTAEVTMSLDEATVLGLAHGPASRGNRLRLLAMATIDALNKLIPELVGLVIEDVSVVTMAQGRVALAMVTRMTQQTEETLIGAALVRHDEKEAVVRATLDAINRRLMA